jgi:DnaJ-class molecular chaperone
MKDYYKILDVSRQSNQKQIRDAYLQLSKRFHPDTNRQDLSFVAKFQIVQEAYETLSQDDRRDEYDSRLKAHELKATGKGYESLSDIIRREKEKKVRIEEEMRRREEERKMMGNAPLKQADSHAEEIISSLSDMIKELSSIRGKFQKNR